MDSKVNKKGLFGIAFLVIAMVIARVLPLPEGIERTGWYALAIFLGAIIMWICDTLPMAVTALATIFILMPVTGVMDLGSIYAAFGGSAFFFCVAAFAISIALEQTSVPLRICSVLTKWSKGSPGKLVLALFLACAITSAIMSNLSTCIIYLSIALALLESNGCKPMESNLGKILMIGLPAISGVGGLITPAGTPGNLLIMDLLKGVGVELTFTQWVLLFAPLAIFTTILCAIWSTIVFKPEAIGKEAMEALEDKLNASGAMTTREKKTVGIILLMLICWLAGTWIPVLNVTVVAIAGMALLFMPGLNVVDWKTISMKTNWNLAFTIGSVGILISGLTNTGIMNWIVSILFANISSWNIVVMFFVVGAVVCIIRAFIPTAPAIAALFGAPLLSLATITAATPVALMFIPAFWACSPMLLWIEPIFLFSYGYGYYKPKDVFKYGAVPCLILFVVMAFTPYWTALFGF
ncbi:MAG: SLC13 family permease [Lachnospiraceae bacterium]|nr:SLC13 family permease [Lachnospiraceae bacterium]